MKKNTSIKIIGLSTLFATALMVGSTLSWLAPTASMENAKNPITGEVQDEYYASGTGTSGDPYVITKPRHLYNLAWLQYLGFYNKNSGDDNHQFYFKLGANIDMSSFGPIPPIGTELNPFVGNFNGMGYVISNVTISNEFSDYTAHPSAISAWDDSTKKQPHILGLFGVIGEYPGGNKNSSYSTTVNEFINTGITGATIKTVLPDSLVGIAAGYVRDSDTSDTHNVLKNVVVDNSTISLPESGATSSYGKDVSNKDLTNISEYGLVGYTNNKSYVVSANKSVYGVNVDNNYSFNATEGGVDNGWGGSIDMKSVLERLITIKNSGTTASFPFKKTYTHHETTGVIDEDPTYSNAAYCTLINNDDQAGHFQFIHRNDTYDQYYAMFGGGYYRTDVYYDGVSHDAFQITDGTNYLLVNSTAIQKTETQSEGSYWLLTSDNYLVTKSGNKYYYLRNNNGTLQAIDGTSSTTNASKWEIDDSGSQRVISNNGYCIRYGANNFELVAGTSTGSGEPYSIRYGTNNYLNNNGTTGVTNSTSEVKIWYFSNYSTTGTTTVYTKINNRNYYLTNSGNSSCALSTTSRNWTWGTNNTYRRLSYTSGSTTYYLNYYNSTWRPRNRTTNADLTITPTTYYSFTTNISKSSNSGTILGPDETLNNSKTTKGMNYDGDDVTYFPLSTINNTDNFKPTESNSAYVVSGSMINDSTASGDYKAGNTSVIRFSNLFSLDDWQLGSNSYPKSLSDDYNYTTGEFSAMYTITKSGNSMQIENIIGDTTHYTRLEDAVDSLGKVMKIDKNPNKKAYGVHFMNSLISMDALTTADYVKVNGKPYTDYQLPVNSIDFNLKEFGYITFIAGTYYRNDNTDRNNSFFSLYQIERLEDTTEEPNRSHQINRILEIKNVYQHSSKNKTYSYVYELSDGTNTFYTKPYVITSSDGDKAWLYDNVNPWAKNQYVNTIPDNYIKVFDVDVIKANSFSSSEFDYHPFYFEIPMNDGEFCLGSVSGGTGAYLMYLDIGANAAKTYRTITYEKFAITQKTYSYPAGVALQSLTLASNGAATINITEVIDASDSACIEIQPTAIGDYTIDRTNNSVALTRANTSLAPPIYAGEGVTFTGEGSLVPVPFSSSSHIIQRMQYYDYMINTNTLCVTTFTDYYSTTGTFENRVIEQRKYQGTAVTANPTSTYIYDPTGILGTAKDESSKMKIYNTSSGASMVSTIFTDHSQLTIDGDRLSKTLILEFKFVQDGGASEYTDSTTLVVAVDNNASQTETYYKYSSYTIVLTPQSGSITITIIDYKGSFVTYTYNDASTTTPNPSSSTVNTVVVINNETVTGIGQVIPNPNP